MVDVLFQIRTSTQWGDEVLITGSCEELGRWKAILGLRTGPDSYPLWSTRVRLKLGENVEYKYVICRGDRVVRWEGFTGNRTLDVPLGGVTSFTIDDGQFGVLRLRSRPKLALEEQPSSSSSARISPPPSASTLASNSAVVSSMPSISVPSPAPFLTGTTSYPLQAPSVGPGGSPSLDSVSVAGITTAPLSRSNSGNGPLYSTDSSDSGVLSPTRAQAYSRSQPSPLRTNKQLESLSGVARHILPHKFIAPGAGTGVNTTYLNGSHGQRGGRSWNVPTSGQTIHFGRKDEQFYEFTNLAEGFPIKMQGRTWPSSQHLYQAQKFPGNEVMLYRLVGLTRPQDAIEFSRKHIPEVRPDWDEVSRVNSLYAAVKAKFEQHPKLRDSLLETGNTFLVMSPAECEGVFQGQAEESTDNLLGRILMFVRDELRRDQGVAVSDGYSASTKTTTDLIHSYQTLSAPPPSETPPNPSIPSKPALLVAGVTSSPQPLSN